MNAAELLQNGRNTARVAAIFLPGRPKEKTVSSGGGAVRAATSVGAICFA